MSDIVERLREYISPDCACGACPLMAEAADEIERLEKLVATLEAALIGKEGKSK